MRPSNEFGATHARQIVPHPKPKRAAQPSKEEAIAKARGFISLVARAPQTPLVPKTKERTTAAPAPTPTVIRRSRRLAKIETTCNVRPSKKGEVLLMRKLGFASADMPITREAQDMYAQLFDRPLSTEHLASIRDLFPTAESLSDEELSMALLQAGEEAAAY